MSRPLEPPPSKVSVFDNQWIRWLFNLFSHLKVENWREVGAAGEPAFENGWVNYDGSPAWDTAAFYKDPFGRVHIKGRVKDGTLNTAIFTLPEGYRPPMNLLFATISGTTTTRIQVHDTGVVTTVGSTTNVSTGLNISFRV